MGNPVHFLREAIASGNYSKILGILSIAVIAIALPVTVFLAQQEQDPRGRAAESAQSCKQSCRTDDQIQLDYVCGDDSECIAESGLTRIVCEQECDRRINNPPEEGSRSYIVPSPTPRINNPPEEGSRSYIAPSPTPRPAWCNRCIQDGGTCSSNGYCNYPTKPSTKCATEGSTFCAQQNPAKNCVNTSTGFSCVTAGGGDAAGGPGSGGSGGGGGGSGGGIGGSGGSGGSGGGFTPNWVCSNNGLDYLAGEFRYQCTGQRGPCASDAGVGIPNRCEASGSWTNTNSEGECTTECNVATDTGSGSSTPPATCPASGDTCTYSESSGKCYSGKGPSGFNVPGCNYSCGPVACPGSQPDNQTTPPSGGASQNVTAFCSAVPTCSGANCSFKVTLVVNGETRSSGFEVAWQPNIGDSRTITGWGSSSTVSHNYGTASEGPYTAQFNVRTGEGYFASCQTTVLGAGGTRVDVGRDCSRSCNGQIRVHVVKDANGNGVKDKGESSVSNGDTIRIVSTDDSRGHVDMTRTTQGTGRAYFDCVPAKASEDKGITYKATFEKAHSGYVITGPATSERINLDACNDTDDVTFLAKATGGGGDDDECKKSSGRPNSCACSSDNQCASNSCKDGLCEGGDTSGSTRINLDLILNTAVDSAQNRGDLNPRQAQRSAIVQLFNNQNQKVAEGTGTLNFDSSSKTFKGTVAMNAPAGSYTARVKTTKHLKELLPQSITAGQSHTIPQTVLVVGDTNNDNILDVADYGNVVECFGDNQCENKEQADLNDDGAVDGVDVNILIRNLLRQFGE